MTPFLMLKITKTQQSPRPQRLKYGSPSPDLGVFFSNQHLSILFLRQPSPIVRQPLPLTGGRTFHLLNAVIKYGCIGTETAVPNQSGYPHRTHYCSGVPYVFFLVHVLASKGMTVVPFELNYLVDSVQSILNITMDADMLSHFDEWQRARDDKKCEPLDEWPVELRRARLIPAVDYLQARGHEVG
ncbi:uncharacterized protein LOC116256417 isoform X1 [Nymphaea colorata]|uniref:uncharacterized protein LOC116256417 isoform X1 n=1 Tax=Nymphaea colorata TaxID=210225 RepID=UPI00129D9E7F|nr:uncharacterized protein LOC116256417 isoform X1 [Nymphaea colorata]